MRIAAVGSALPPHYYDQDVLIEAFRKHWAKRHFNLDRLEQLHRNVLVGGRHLSLPIEDYDGLTTWGQANDAWIRVSQEVGERAIRDALDRSNLTVDDVDCLFTVTVTGVAFPDHVAVLLSVELCSLTLQREDLSIPNLIASGLFGDGGAAAVVVGANRRADGPRVIDTRSVFYPNSEDVMGWDISESGFRIVLSAGVPEVVRQHLRGDVDAFLADNHLTRRDIRTWISHPGGPKVLEAIQDALELPGDALESSWRSLREVGNLSSTSVLLVLEETLERSAAEPGSFGLMVALGPGFCSELVLLRW